MTNKEIKRRMRLAEARWVTSRPKTPYTIGNSKTGYRKVQKYEDHLILEVLVMLLLFLGVILFLYA